MPNPDGYNAFGGPLEREMPYGDVAKQQALTRLAGTANPSAVNAPRRSKRHATGQDRPRKSAKNRAQTEALPVPPSPPQVPYEQVLASFWMELASEPGASPLIQEIAGSLGG